MAPGAPRLLLAVKAGDLQTLADAPIQSEALALLFPGGFVLVALCYGVLSVVDRRMYSTSPDTFEKIDEGDAASG